MSTEYQAIGNPPAGSIRFNTDSNKMEIYNGEQWWNIDSTSPEEQTGGTRGLIGSSSASPSPSNAIDFFNLDTTGNGTDFGNLSVARHGTSASSSRTRGIFLGGQEPAVSTVIDFVAIASQGNATDFGDVSYNGFLSTSWSNGTRLIKAGGEAPSPAHTINSAEYITIAQTGNAVDFGDLSEKRRRSMAIGSPTRMLICGGYSSPANKDTIDFFTFSTTGNATDFGNLSEAKNTGGGSSNAITGIVTDTTDYDKITIATLGNGVNTADLSSTRTAFGSTSSRTRAVFGGGYSPSSPYPATNIIDYQQFTSTGNFIDFGDLSTTFQLTAGLSNGHGGLG
tara:strand:+ start:1890 stop:2903 length:1014 start_codon:yes stop_codon:yes gene_type:complete